MHFADELDITISLASMECSISGGCDDEDYHYRYRRGRGRWRDYHECDMDCPEECDAYERERHGGRGGHHTIVDEIDRRLELRRVIDLDGTPLVQGVEINEGRIAHDGVDYDNRTPDQEDYEGFTGNAGVSATHW